MIEIRSLEGVSFERMTAAFNDAFSDYDIPANYTVEYLTNLVVRRGYRPDLAVGAFDDDRLVGFVFNCLDGDEAYNSGTGVVISHRRRGIGRQLMQRSIETLPANRYILEVIDSNHRAEALYRQLGFVEMRRLQSWKLATPHPPLGGDLSPRERSVGTERDRVRGIDESWWDQRPSWQNTLASLRRAREPYEILGDDRGYIVVFPSNGDVPLLAVRSDQRRKGIGRELLAAASHCVGKPLRIMNAEDRFERFLERCGATKLVRQIEMMKTR
ncbi:MAG TPA: GNAT family N-acetyltransferase [Thermoanaerobaculia bacterium]|nr:GNAT family N-acetyltransferase [Thermoanaerobaculia bacterium]